MPRGQGAGGGHNSKVVTECMAICAYLADAFPDTGLAPPPAEHADHYRWLFFAAGPVEAAITNTALGFVVPPAASGRRATGRCTTRSRRRNRPCPAGDRFTVAGGQVGWGLGFGTVPPGPPSNPTPPACSDAPPISGRRRSTTP